ncbi:MAG: ABC transporter substrate-binding protein [Patescibacteria group bacterium]|nr:ABC transporter substrate-binding protein [Patescibacteria group bacterium]
MLAGGYRWGFIFEGGFKHLVTKFSKAEKTTVLILIGVILISIAGSVINYNRNSVVRPVPGGVFIEGVVGQSRVVNPLFIQANTLDNDIVKLVFAGLVQVGPGHEFLPDLAESWEVEDKGKTYIFKLRPHLTFHDGELLTSEDVVFTIDVIKSEAYGGVFRSEWAGINVIAIDELTVRMELPEPSTYFLAKASVGILPMHLMGHLPVADIGTPEYNKHPVGAGPYKWAAPLAGQTGVHLKSFDAYYGGKPYIEKIIFRGFDNERDLFTALVNGNVTAAGFTTTVFTEETSLLNTNQYDYHMPQYKAVFFNILGENKALGYTEIRQALGYATNKDRIIREITDNHAMRADSPILPGFWGHLPDMEKYDFDYAAAKELLEKRGWGDVDGDGFLEKDNVRFSFTLSFKDDKVNAELAKVLAEDWQVIGAEVKLDPVDPADLINQVIRPRAYDALIFGQNLGSDSDPYAYWHSSQTSDPGLALSIIYEKDIDNSLEFIRMASELNRAIAYSHRFQKAFANSVPAILMYQPNYTYLVDSKIKGTTGSIHLSSTADRFSGIGQWYVRSRKVLE